MYDRRGPLQRVLALEAEGPGAAPRYALALYDLAAVLRRKRRGEATREDLVRWLLDALGVRSADTVEARRTAWEEAQWDAAVDLVADADALASFIEQVADRVGDARPRNLNLRSLLRARVVWRARDKMRRREALRARRAAAREAADVPSGHEASRWVARLVLQRVAERFGDEDAVVEALAGLLEGRSVSEVARATGLSRQQIYRRLARVRAFIEAEGAEASKRAGAER